MKFNFQFLKTKTRVKNLFQFELIFKRFINKIAYNFINQFDMSYQQNTNITQFIPNYVVRSDYLPNTKVVDGNTTQTSQLVISYLCLASSI